MVSTFFFFLSFFFSFSPASHLVFPQKGLFHVPSQKVCANILTGPFLATFWGHEHTVFSFVSRKRILCLV